MFCIASVPPLLVPRRAGTKHLEQVRPDPARARVSPPRKQHRGTSSIPTRDPCTESDAVNDTSIDINETKSYDDLWHCALFWIVNYR